jgi:uncharacterized protein YbjT (DUF2867 family)
MLYLKLQSTGVPMATSKQAPVLVTGATGRQGGAVARHLLRRAIPVRALSRDPSKPSAEALARSGAEVIGGDLDDRASLTKAMEGVSGVFSVQNWWETGTRREIEQGRNVADAAKDARVPHFIYSSVGGADRGADITHWKTKWTVENHVRMLGLPATILRPVGFMENYYIPAVEKALIGGTLLDAVRMDKPYQLICADDIGAFAALAFAKPERFIGKAIEIAGDELTNPDIAATFGRVMGRPVKFRKLPLLLTRIMLGKEFHQMFKWFNEAGFQADIPSLRRDYPEIVLTSLEGWLTREGWANKKSYVRHAKTFDARIPKAA